VSHSVRRTRERAGGGSFWLSTFDRWTCVGSRWVGEQINNIRWEQTLRVIVWASGDNALSQTRASSEKSSS
jgi:hypothetical protein